MLCLGNGNATNAAGNDDAAAVQVHLRPVQTTAFHGLPGSHHSKLGEPPHPLCSLTVQHRLRLEVLDLCSQLDLQPRWIILGDGPNAAHPLAHGFPALLGCEAQWGHSAYPGNHNSSLAHTLSSYMAMPPSTARTWPVM